MNLLDEVDRIKKEGYSEANAEAKLCQDIIINAISKSSLNRNVTIKGGVVMRSLSGEARRATQDIDLDFIRYSISEDSVKMFVEKLNCLDGIKLRIASPIEELRHQDYKGKRVYIEVSDRAGNVLTTKMDIGVHKDLDIEQLRQCIGRYIFEDTTLGVSDTEEIKKRSERIFTNSTYKKQVERSRKNWLDMSVEDVLKKDLQFIQEI